MNAIYQQVSSPKKDLKDSKNPNSKIPDSFETLLITNFKQNPSLIDHERRKDWRYKFRITRKIAKVLFTERYTHEHLK